MFELFYEYANRKQNNWIAQLYWDLYNNWWKKLNTLYFLFNNYTQSTSGTRFFYYI